MSDNLKRAVEIYKNQKNFIFCTNCKKEVKKAMYDTGEEEYCRCQCTLDAKFNPKLWKKQT